MPSRTTALRLAVLDRRSAPADDRGVEPPPLDMLLRKLPLFAAVDQPNLARIGAASRIRRYGDGQAIVREGEPCRALFALIAGSVKMYRLAPDGREQVLARLSPGQTFAEAAVLTMPVYPANAVATDPGTEVIEVGAATFLQVFEGDPRVGKAIVASLSSWLLRMVGRVEELTVLSAGARLARYLLDLPSKPSRGGPVIDLPIAKKDLAANLGITPETLSRLLRKWQDGKVIRGDGAHILIREPEVMLAIAQDAATA